MNKDAALVLQATMTSATPKPRAGEQAGSRTPLVDAIIKKFPHSAQLEELARNLEAERELLRERERELAEALELAAHFLEPRGAIASLAPGSDASHLYRKLRALLAKHGR